MMDIDVQDNFSVVVNKTVQRSNTSWKSVSL